MYHVSSVLQSTYESSDERGKNENREDRSEIYGGDEKVEIT